MDRTQLESAAANYSYLRGLFFIPLGMLFILAALANWEWGPLRHTWVFFAGVTVVGAICLLLNRYYNDNYGRLHPSTSQQRRGAVAVVIGLAIILGGSSLLRSEASWSLDLPVNAMAVTFALIMLLSYGVGVGVKTHHAIIWGALFVAGALPVWNGADPSNIGLFMAGVAVMVSGVFDHRLFVRTFGSPGLPALENGDVGA
jgi:multisubunit Na+/H+ antiporter MnhG subunit